MNQQIVSYECLFDKVKEGGYYIVEDLHTSYWVAFGGGLRKKGSFIEYSKDFVDHLNHQYIEEKNTEKIDGNKVALHYYDSLLFIEKQSTNFSFDVYSGIPSFILCKISYFFFLKKKNTVKFFIQKLQ